MKVDRGKSSLQCFTKKKIMVPSAIVVNDDTEHIFELSLMAGVKKTTLRSGKLLPARKDFNFVSTSIHQELLDYTESDLMEVPKKRKLNKGNCLYQDAENVSWTECQATGVHIKVLHLIKEKKPNTCFKFRKMSNNSMAGPREYKRDIETARNKVPFNEESKNLAGQRKGQFDCSKALGGIGETDRSGWKQYSTKTWPDNTIRYDPTEVPKESDKTYVKDVLAQLQKDTNQCIKFEIDTTSKDRLKLRALKSNDVAYGSLGYFKGGGVLGLRPDGWTDAWLILHEFGHVIGLSHTQNREDAACYVRLFPNNFAPKMLKAFEPDDNIKSVFKYDYRSVMHYRRNMFAIDKNGDHTTSKDTILPIEQNSWANNIIGKTQVASTTDIQTIQHYYKCPAIVIRWLGWKTSPKIGQMMSPSATFCPDGMFVYGYRLRSQPKKGFWGDDTALNDIELYCKHYQKWPEGMKIWSSFTSSGEWSGDQMCSGRSDPVVGFRVLSEAWQGPWGDSTGINAVALLCKDNGWRTIYMGIFPIQVQHGQLYAGVKTSWGSWFPWQKCPEGMAVMGIRTQILTKLSYYNDKMSITGLELYCKTFN